MGEREENAAALMRERQKKRHDISGIGASENALRGMITTRDYKGGKLIGSESKGSILGRLAAATRKKE